MILFSPSRNFRITSSWRNKRKGDVLLDGLDIPVVFSVPVYDYPLVEYVDWSRAHPSFASWNIQWESLVEWMNIHLRIASQHLWGWHSIPLFPVCDQQRSTLTNDVLLDWSRPLWSVSRSRTTNGASVWCTDQLMSANRSFQWRFWSVIATAEVMYRSSRETRNRHVVTRETVEMTMASLLRLYSVRQQWSRDVPVA